VVLLLQHRDGPDRACPGRDAHHAGRLIGRQAVHRRRGGVLPGLPGQRLLRPLRDPAVPGRRDGQPVAARQAHRLARAVRAVHPGRRRRRRQRRVVGPHRSRPCRLADRGRPGHHPRAGGGARSPGGCARRRRPAGRVTPRGPACGWGPARRRLGFWAAARCP